MPEVSESEARDAAFALRASWADASSATDGLKIDAAAMKVAAAVTCDVRILNDHASASPGRPKDFVAPTAWHAACCLFIIAFGNRVSHRAFYDAEAFIDFYGKRAVFRGQAKPWRIEPTAWRKRFPTHQGLRAIAQYLRTITTEDDAPEFELFGRLRSLKDAAGIAQHYGMPTNLIDFTFDPLAAVFFALTECEQSSVSALGLSDHAVVYSAPISKIAEIGGVRFAFPPLRADRLFRQSGLFVDFGSKREAKKAGRISPDGISLIEGGCGRCFFPRDYPVAQQAESFDREFYLRPEPFFDELVEAAEVYALTRVTENAASYIAGKLSSRPPWYIGTLDGGGFYSDDSFLVVGRMIERYLVFAALVNTADGSGLDPALIGLISQHDDRILSALHTLSSLKGSSLESLAPTTTQIVRSFRCLEMAKAHFYPRS